MCFSISKEFWRGYPFYDTLPERVPGKFEKWLNIAARRPKILWADGEDTLLCLEDLLHPDFKFQLEKNEETGKLPPKPRRRRNEEGAERVGHAPALDSDERGQTVDVPYKVGNREEVQTWEYCTPEAITEDHRRAERHRPAVNRDGQAYRTPYDFFVNVALPFELIKSMFGDQGWMNQRLSGADNSYKNRKTTVGEGLQFIGYMIALANNPGAPLYMMWAEKNGPGDKKVLPAANMGRYGMGENRFRRLQSIVAQCYSVSMAELDASDPWRYVSPMVDAFNAHWKEVYFPSWLLSPDELMCPWTVDEGDGPNDIPWSSWVPRKPKPKGCEMKCVCDGESGVMLRVEIALKYKRKRGTLAAEVPYEDEWGATSAQCLRLCEPWHNSDRVFGADAHFMCVDSVEALMEHVRFASLAIAHAMAQLDAAT